LFCVGRALLTQSYQIWRHFLDDWTRWAALPIKKRGKLGNGKRRRLRFGSVFSLADHDPKGSRESWK
jgi:hypothetical protein